jgi:4-hydroxy-2-oxoheptanedioate aldolase
MPENELKARWRHGEPAFGAWCSSGSPVVAEVLALQSFDYIAFDLQHGLMGFEGLLACLQAVARTGTTPLARVPVNDVAWIGKAIDAGCQGVIIPMVNSAEEADLAVRNTRLFPLGQRSFGPIRIGQALGRDPVVLNREIACVVMIETVEGVKNADAICSVPGVDAVYVGPADLALTYGLDPNATVHPDEHAAACESIRHAAERAGIVVGIHCDTGESARHMADSGYKMMSIGSDIGFVRQAALKELTALA